MSSKDKQNEGSTQKKLEGRQCFFCSRPPHIAVRLEFTSAESVFDGTETTRYSQPLWFCFNCGHSFWEAAMEVIVDPIERFLHNHAEDETAE